ncbi:MAG: hypothetical protein KDE27_05455 [Planctomycetes bacterium]|nr:hypothetical protein [Planctomycetota bacterium]
MRKEDMPPADAPMIQLARYRCHKDVLAAKITAVQHLRDGSASLTIVDEHGNEVVGFGVSPSYVAKHEPQVGGYYVCYSDGYESWSPAHQFEQGYARLDGGQNSSERGVDLRVHILEFGQIVDTESQDLNLVMRARPFDVPEKELRPSSAINQVVSSSTVEKHELAGLSPSSVKQVLRERRDALGHEFGIACARKLTGTNYDG